MNNTKYGREKQISREFVFKVFKKEIPKNKAVRCLTFPAEQGLQYLTSKAKPSLEGLVKNHFLKADLVGIEGNARYFKKLRKTYKNALKYMELTNEYDRTFFNKSVGQFNLLWLDYMGGTSKENREALIRALENRAFSNKSVLAITLCSTPRTIGCRSLKLFFRHSKDGTLESGHFHWFKKRAKRLGYKVSLIEVFSYKNVDLSKKASPMKIIFYRVELI